MSLTFLVVDIYKASRKAFHDPIVQIPNMLKVFPLLHEIQHHTWIRFAALPMNNT